LRDTRTPFLFVAPVFALLGFVLLSPVAYAFWFSLFRIEYGAPTNFAGLRNYERLLDDHVLIATIGRTAFHSFSSVALTILVALALSVWIHRLPRIAGLIAQMIVIIPWIISTVVATLLFRWVFVSDIGIASYLLSFVIGGISEILATPSGAMALLIVVSVWKRIGYAVIVLLAGLKSIPAELEEAARIDGASAWQVFRRITLPLLKTPLLLVAVVLTLSNINTVETPLILTGGGPRDATRILAIDVYERAFAIFDLGTATALALLMFAGNILLVLAYVRLSRWRA
jgi:ABC-type sugar transport system permease subunit